MKVICVDDEKLILELTVSLCRDISLVEDVRGFSSATEALDYIEKNRVDAALLDIDMPDMNGIKLATAIKGVSPDTSVIFLTGYSQYAVDAFSVRATGYLLKPIDKEALKKELEYANSKAKDSFTNTRKSHVVVQTFGNFDVFVDGKMVNFSRSKAKELLAYLIDKRGSSQTRTDIFAVLWEEGIYDRSKQKQLDVMIRSLRDTLNEYGISDILSVEKGALRICPEKIDCDMYRFMEGDVAAINSYRGEYMSSYYWAEITEGYITRRIEEKI
ncbi:Two-component response regulator, SAPR family, consists of REC, wHTH and BTAD domains [Eubacterium ruminantium]|nr:Two-component response regulator, SAPR family, consists of REC, wHTH and BTAD domains [Eubacterium ruminantium]